MLHLCFAALLGYAVCHLQHEDVLPGFGEMWRWLVSQAQAMPCSHDGELVSGADGSLCLSPDRRADLREIEGVLETERPAPVRTEGR